MEVYTQPDIDVASTSYRGNGVAANYGIVHEDKENLVPCGNAPSHHTSAAEGNDPKSQVSTRSVLADVTYRFPAEAGAFLVEPEAPLAIENLNSRRQNPEQLAHNATAAANRLRRMR